MPGVPPVDVRARVTFEWMPGGRFLVERWEVPLPEVPDGLAVIGYDEGWGTYRQHYSDSRGVARVYEMGLSDGVWTLERKKPDFSPLDIRQRWTGTFGPDGRTITGRWEIATVTESGRPTSTCATSGRGRPLTRSAQNGTVTPPR